jgi:integrase
VFTTEARGVALNRHGWNAVWREARAKVGLPGVRYHDLRHVGNHQAAMAGATTREMMTRMGHSSMRAALIYQQATESRDAAIAKAMGEAIAPATVTPIDAAK